jgi:hypothetical protein
MSTEVKTEVKTKLEANWSGKILSEIVEFNGKTFKIVTGFKNGGGENCTYILNNTGWTSFLDRNDIPSDNYDNGASYVSDETRRKEYSINLNKEFKVAIYKVFS